MDGLERYMLNEISQTKTNIVWYHFYVEFLKYSKLVNITITTTKQIHKYTGQTSGNQWGEGSGEGLHKGRGLRGTKYYVQNKVEAYIWE